MSSAESSTLSQMKSYFIPFTMTAVITDSVNDVEVLLITVSKKVMTWLLRKGSCEVKILIIIKLICWKYLVGDVAGVST